MSSRIQDLLEAAERQAERDAPEKSSVSHAARKFANPSDAEKNFNRLKEKLFRIESWNNESLATSFELFDGDGNTRRDQSAKVGDFMKTTLPGSGKDDWVKIIDIHEAPEEIVLTVKPSFDPTEKKADKTVTSHFFTDESTNNFCLQKAGPSLNFYVVGLSEKTNTEETQNFLETARNAATANLGRYLGIQKAQWKTFCENFLEIEAEK